MAGPDGLSGHVKSAPRHASDVESHYATQLSSFHSQPEPRSTVPLIRHPTLRRLLERHGRTASFISGMISLLSKFTLQEDDNERSVSPEWDKEIAMMLASQGRKAQDANAAVISACCSRASDCLHRALLENRFPTHLDFFVEQVNEVDAFSNNFLFFAARAGAPFAILMRIVDVIENINVRNADSHTFLFVLDPGSFPETKLGRQQLASLLGVLQSRNFDFMHMDNEGRSFLSYITVHPNSGTHWFGAMRNQLKYDMRFFEETRDCKGGFLVDYALCRWHFKPRDSLLPSALYDPSDPGLLGRSVGDPKATVNRRRQLGYEYCEKSFPVPFPSLGGLDDYLSRNKYQIDGMTDLFRALLHRLQEGSGVDLSSHDDERINFNSRCLDGQTVLHLSAIYNRDDVLRQILAIRSQEIRVNDRDHHGLTALDYAVNWFNRSRTPTGTAEQLAKALMCITSLIDHGAHMTFSPNTQNGKSIRTPVGKNVVIPESEPFVLNLQCMAPLQEWWGDANIRLDVEYLRTAIL
jgi:hypothetical protein